MRIYIYIYIYKFIGSCFRRKNRGGGVAFGASSEPIGVVNREIYVTGHFKSRGLNKREHRCLTFSSAHPSKCSPSINPRSVFLHPRLFSSHEPTHSQYRNSLLTKAKAKTRVFKNRVLREIFGPDRKEMAGGWRKTE
jgi:hypothetical protein